MTRISYLNSQFLEHDKCLVHIEDRGFQFADSAYEVTLFYNNKLIDSENHINRLFNSLKKLNIHHNFSKKQIYDIQIELLKRNNINNYGYCYINITRGRHNRVPNQPNTKAVTINATVSSIEKFDIKKITPITVISSKDIRWLRCDIKSSGLCASSMIRQKANNMGFDDAIMHRNQFVTESTYANVFYVDAYNNLITRPCDNKILCGITRNRIIKIAKENNINIIEKKFKINEIKTAKEVFLTSSTMLIRPVAKIDDQIISKKIGKITKKLLEHYLIEISK